MIEELVVRVMREMPIIDMQRFGQTAFGYAHLARTELEIRVAHNLKAHIGKYDAQSGHSMNWTIRDPINDFLFTLRDVRAVVGGETVLALLLAQTGHDGDWVDHRPLEIYTPMDRAASVIQYLTATEGYCIVNVASHAPGPARDAVAAVQRSILRAAGADDTSETNVNSDSESSTDEEDEEPVVPTPQSIHGEGIESITYLYRPLNDAVAVIYESSSPSALTPISISPTTLLVTKVCDSIWHCMPHTLRIFTR